MHEKRYHRHLHMRLASQFVSRLGMEQRTLDGPSSSVHHILTSQQQQRNGHKGIPRDKDSAASHSDVCIFEEFQSCECFLMPLSRCSSQRDLRVRSHMQPSTTTAYRELPACQAGLGRQRNPLRLIRFVEPLRPDAQRVEGV